MDESQYLNLYFREIIYKNPKSKKDSVCGVFSYEAMNAEDVNLGNLYLVGKISNVPKRKYKNSDFLLNLLASAIKRDFYSNHQRSTLEALESALQGANIYLNDFTKKGHKEWIGNLHFTAMAFRHNEIYIGQTGNMLFHLFRKNSASNISKKFQNDENPEPIKTFSNIANGKLTEGDKILIANSELSEILTSQKAKELTSYRSADKLYYYLKNNLEKLNSLTCLILEAEMKPPQNHAEEIIESKEAEEFTLDLKEILDVKAKKINKIIKDQFILPNKLTVFILKHHIIKYIFALLIVLLIVFAPYLIEKINYDIKIRKIDNLLLRIEENTKRSEDALVYQNQLWAQSFLKQANSMIEELDLIFKKLPEDAKEKISQKISSIQEKFNKQKNSLNNIINITQAEKIADLLKNTYSFNPKGILKLAEKLYLYELGSGFLYEIDLIDNQSTLVFLSSKDTFKLGATVDDKILLLTNPEKVSVYDIIEDYNIYLLKPNLENTLNIKDMTNFGNDIFFLDTEKAIIWKYVQTGDVLNGAAWLSSEELRNSQSLAIDGNVFVSRDNGAINVYTKGKKVRELRFDISPPLEKGGKLFTREGMKNLYILDQANSRIVVYNKQDGFIKQFVIPNLSNLNDLWVESDEKIIYLLNGLEVYKIEI